MYGLLPVIESVMLTGKTGKINKTCNTMSAYKNVMALVEFPIKESKFRYVIFPFTQMKSFLNGSL